MNRLEKAILDRLESKSSHEYMWPRWPAADEASIAALELIQELYEESHGDIDYILWALKRPV